MDDLHGILDKALQHDLDDLDRPADYSDESLALRFTERHHAGLRYVHKWGEWMWWDGRKWNRDETLKAFDLARGVAREASAEVTHRQGERRLGSIVGSAKTVAAIDRLARADRRHASVTEDWDLDDWLLNTPDGTVDLRTGELRPHDAGDLITRMTAVGPGGECPIWDAFLLKVFQGDAELVAFVWRMLGYSLTGSTKEHALFFCYGTGGNGKGTLLDSWCGIMADYAKVASMPTFTASNVDRHPTDLAMLRGARVVTSQETEDRQHWAEARIKQLTGGDPVTARFMRQDFFTYIPTFKLIIVGNFKPSLKSVDEAIKRRFFLIPFNWSVTPAENNRDLRGQLRAEWPGILAKAIKGCLDWQRQGLAPPPAVLAATKSYLADEDAFGRFLAERCVLGEASAVAEVKTLFGSWREWCEVTREAVGTEKRFSQCLEAQGFERCYHPGNRRSCFRGIRLPADDSVGLLG